MVLPQPYLPNKRDGATASLGENAVPGERQRRGMKDPCSDVDERNYEEKFQWVDNVIRKLRRRHVQSQDEGRGQAQDCGAAQQRIDADHEANGDTPCQVPRRSSHAQEGKDG